MNQFINYSGKAIELLILTKMKLLHSFKTLTGLCLAFWKRNYVQKISHIKWNLF